MPIMPRQKNKARKIFYSILGEPSNMRKRKKPKNKKSDKKSKLEEPFR